MAHKSSQSQRYQPPSRRPPPLPEDELPELRDPDEGLPPALQEGTELIDPQAIAAQVQQRPTIGVRGEPIEDGERDPDTIAEEQRRRSEEMQEVGIYAWMAARDSRTPEELAASQFVAEEPRGEVIHRGGGRFNNGNRLTYREDERA